MFFRSARALLIAVILLCIGVFQLLKGLHYREVAARENSTVGTILYVINGRSPDYQYRYRVNGTWMRDDSGSCKTELTQAACKAGSPVVVYYDRNKVTETLLEEFGAAGRERLFFGAFMSGAGLLLLGLYPAARKALASPDESEETDVDTNPIGPDVIHVVPTEDISGPG